MVLGLASSILASPIVEKTSDVLPRAPDIEEFTYSAEYIKGLELRPPVTDIWNNTTAIEHGNGTPLNRRQWTSGWDCSIFIGWGMNFNSCVKQTNFSLVRLTSMCNFQETKENP